MVAIERKTRDWQKMARRNSLSRLQASAESYRGFLQKEATLIGIAGMNFAAALQQLIRPALLRKGGSAMSQVDSSSAKKSTELTLIDRLSRLSYHQTLKLLGSDGPKLLRAGDSWDFRIEEDVCLSEDLFRLKLDRKSTRLNSSHSQ